MTTPSPTIKPDACWNCGYEGDEGIVAYEELDDYMFECRRCHHFLTRYGYQRL